MIHGAARYYLYSAMAAACRWPASVCGSAAIKWFLTSSCSAPPSRIQSRHRTVTLELFHCRSTRSGVLQWACQKKKNKKKQHHLDVFHLFTPQKSENCIETSWCCLVSPLWGHIQHLREHEHGVSLRWIRSSLWDSPCYFQTCQGSCNTGLPELFSDLYFKKNNNDNI